MQKSEYRQVFAISQSAIKAFKTKSLQKFKKIYIDQIEEDDEDLSKFAFGSLVDTLAFEPNLLEKRFFIPEVDVQIPGEKVKFIIDKVYREAEEILKNKLELNRVGNLPEPLYIPNIEDLYEWTDLIIKYARENKYGGSTWTEKTIIKNVCEDGYNYFKFLSESNGRTMITQRDNLEAIEVVDVLRKDPLTLPYFVQQENETLLFQQEVYTSFITSEGRKIPMKGALDIIRLKHDTRTAIVPDLKTTYNADTFKTVAKSFDYINQASVYNFLIKEFLKTYENGKYQDYTIELPINIVIDKEYKVPYIYEYSWRDVEIAEVGKEEYCEKNMLFKESIISDITGWRSIVNDIAWHIEKNVWNKPRELYETNKIKLKIFN
jgi:hypothetical protein